MGGEGGHVAERDLPDLAVTHLGVDGDQAGGGFELEVSDGLAGEDHAGFDEHGDDADGVRARHGRILDLFHDDEAGIGLGRVGGRMRLQLAAG